MVLKRLRLRFGCAATRTVRLPIARATVRSTAVTTSATTPFSVRACSVLCKIDVSVFAKTIIHLFLAEKKNPFHSGFFFLTGSSQTKVLLWLEEYPQGEVSQKK